MWLDNITEDCEEPNLTIHQASRLAKERVKWRNTVHNKGSRSAGTSASLQRLEVKSSHSATMPWQDVSPSVCLSVCLSHASYVSKRLYISSNFFHHRVAPPFAFFRTKRDGNIPTGASNARGYEKITIFDQYLALSRK